MANHFDVPGEDPPQIELATVGVLDSGAMRLVVTSGGKLVRYTVKPHVAATIIKALAEGLAALHTGDHS